MISKKVFMKSICKSQFPQKNVNLSFSITKIKNQLTDLCGNRLLQNDHINTFCKTRYINLASCVFTEQRGNALIRVKSSGFGSEISDFSFWLLGSRLQV